MGFARAQQPLHCPALAETEYASAVGAAADNHAGGAVAQRIFNKGWWHLGDTHQVQGQYVGAGQAAYIGTMLAAEHDDLVRPLAQRRQTACQALAQRADRCGRHVDAGDQLGRAAKRRGRRACTDTDAATGTQIGIDLCHLAPAPDRVRNHCHCGVRAVVEAAPATVAVGRVHHGDRSCSRLRQEWQHEQQGQRGQEQGPDHAG